MFREAQAVTPDTRSRRIANPIHAEVVPRHLNAAVQAGLPHERAWFVGTDGALDMDG